MQPLSSRVEWLEDELEPRKAGGLVDWIKMNVTAPGITQAPSSSNAAAIGSLMLELSGNPRPAISSGRRVGKTATLNPGRGAGPPDSTVRPGSPAYTVVTGWDVPAPGSTLRTTFGPITVLKTRWSGLDAGDVLRSQRTGEYMAVVHAPPATPGVLYVTRGIGSVAPMALKYGDVLDFVVQSGTGKWSAHAVAPPGQFNYTQIRAAVGYGPTASNAGPNSLPGLGAAGEVELAIEPVIAFRVFKVDVDETFEIALRSVSYDTLWPRQAELVATCRHHLGRYGPDGSPANHEAPVLGCSCGIYLTKSIHKSMERASGPLVVLAVVRGWGKVVKHETGWRVQKAYPVGIAVIGRSIFFGRPFDAKWADAYLGAKLRDAYAVPVTLIERAPTGDVTAEDYAISMGWLDGK